MTEELKAFEWPVYAVKMKGEGNLYYFDMEDGNRYNTGDGWLVLLPWGEERKRRAFGPDNRVIREHDEVESITLLNDTRAPAPSVPGLTEEEALRKALEGIREVVSELRKLPRIPSPEQADVVMAGYGKIEMLSAHALFRDQVTEGCDCQVCVRRLSSAPSVTGGEAVTRALARLRCDAWRWNVKDKRYDDVRDDVAIVEAEIARLSAPPPVDAGLRQAVEAIVSKAQDAYTRLSRIGWDRTEKQAIEGAIEDLLAIRGLHAACCFGEADTVGENW